MIKSSTIQNITQFTNTSNIPKRYGGGEIKLYYRQTSSLMGRSDLEIKKRYYIASNH